MPDDLPFLLPGPASLGGVAVDVGAPLGRVGDALRYDARLDGRPVRLREYAPLGVSRRREDGGLEPVEQRFAQPWGDARRLFLDQAGRLAALDHYALPTVVRSFPAGEGSYLATRPTGPSLAAALGAGLTLPPEAIMRIAAELADALATIHARGLTHLDIAPETVSIAEGWAELTDFAVDNRPFMALLGSQDGLVRPGYSPIERYDAAAAEPLGPPADVFGASALLYRLIEGRDPAPWQDRFRDPSLALLLDRAPYPPAFLAAIRQGLAIEPGDRFPDGSAWQAALALPPATQLPAVAAPPPATPPPYAAPTPPPMPALNWVIPLLVGFLILLLAGLAFFAYTQRWFAGPEVATGPVNTIAPLPSPTPAPQPRPEAPPALAIGSTVAGRLTQADQRGSAGAFEDRFTIEARGGERIEISLSSPDFDPVLRLTGPGLSTGNDDDTDAETRDSRLVVTFPRAGRYTLAVSSYDRGETGGYLLQLAAAAPEPPADGVTTLDRTAAARLAGRWHGEDDPQCAEPAINAVTGDRLISRIGGDTYSHRILATDGDSVRTTVTSGSLSGAIFTFRLAPDGDSYEIEGETWTRC